MADAIDHTIVLALEQFVTAAAKETSGLRTNYPINARDLDEAKLAAAVKAVGEKLGRPVEFRRDGHHLYLSTGAK